MRAAAAVALARWTVLLNAVLHARAYLVIMGSFDLAEFLGTIANYKCTYAFIAPPVAVLPVTTFAAMAANRAMPR